MTIGELLEQLRTCPKDTLVELESHCGQIHECSQIVGRYVDGQRSHVLCVEGGYISGSQLVQQRIKTDKAKMKNSCVKKSYRGARAEQIFFAGEKLKGIQNEKI